MAASEPRSRSAVEPGKIGAGHEGNATAKHRGSLDVVFYALTIAIFAATVVTALFVVIEHWLNTYKSWAYYTIGLALVPSCFVQILSLKWYQTNSKLRRHQWISHIFQLAVVHRFCFLLNSALKTMKSQVSLEQRDWIFRIESDAFALNLFTSLLVSIPQIILQLYIMAMLQHVSFWTTASVIASLCSLTWALTAYALLTNRSSQDRAPFTWSCMMIQGFWRGGMLISRIAALVLAAICFKAWILLIFAIHALGMTVWIVQQPTNFCSTTVEEMAYKCLIGAVYFFDFLRLSDNQVRYHVCAFYSVMLVQNAIFYAVYLVSFKDLFQTNIIIITTVMILGGSLVGAVSMLIHFCMFQNVKTIKLCKRVNCDAEISIKVSPTKSISKSPSKNKDAKANNSAEIIMPDVTADKKSLLTNIVQNTESMEKGIVNTSFVKSDETNVTVQVVVEDSKVTNIDVSIEKMQSHAATDKRFEDAGSVNISVEASDHIKNSNTDSLHRQKRRGICSDVELDLKPSENCNLDLDPLCSQKRRGICSLTQLGLELVTDEDNYVEKSFSSLDKLKSNSEVSLNIEDKSLNSTIINALPIKSLIASGHGDPTILENILVRGRLHTPVISETGETTIANQSSEKPEDEQKQEEETMSQVTSIHDYENLCPLGVARPPWCIRSWKGYTDIETYIHDDSVVRDRRRDTLTSTATGTTVSSDFSDATYASLRKLVKRSRQDDYLDTLIYDLVDWESISNRVPVEEISTTTTSESVDDPQDQASLFSAKPIVIDEKGGMLALDTIVEEREDHSSFPDLQMSLRNQNTYSVSSLVTTIDEIRKCTAENSPRHVYHRTESNWEDLEQKIFMNRAHLAKVLFTNDYSNVTLSYGDSWSGSIVPDRNTDKLSIIREMTNYCLNDSSGKTPLINAILSDSPILGPKTETQTCENDDLLEENNVYVDMNVLGAQKCSEEDHKDHDSPETDKDLLLLPTPIIVKNNENRSNEKLEDCSRKKVAFLLTNEIINDSLETSSEKSDSSSIKDKTSSNTVTFCSDIKRRTINRPRRKFSLLRERFEPKSSDKIVYVVSPASQNKTSNRPQLNSLNKRISVIFNDPDAFDSSIKYDKENLTTKSSTTFDERAKNSDSPKEKRSVFLKQVLSPPRFQGWGKKRTFSPNAKILPKAIQ